MDQKKYNMIRILCLHIASNQASYRYRIGQFLPYWKDYGIDMHPVQITGTSYLEKMSLVMQSSNYDYVWLQRKPLTPFFTRLLAKRSRLLYDYDDALYAIESYRKIKPKPTQPGSEQIISRLNLALKKSSLVFAGSPALADYARKFNPDNTCIIPTAYEKITDEPIIDKEKPLTIGWIGNTGNLYFLSMIDQATAAIQSRFPHVRFTVMSGNAPQKLKTNWKFVPWSTDAEKGWLQSIDIGVMPLVDDDWSRGKCAFKLLQYMAHGKPVVASAVGANCQAVIDRISGFLATTPDEWIRAMEILISDPERREAMGRESRIHFLASYERQQVQEQMATILHKHLETYRIKQ